MKSINNYTITRNERKGETWYNLEGINTRENGYNCAVASSIKELIKYMRRARALNPLATDTTDTTTTDTTPAPKATDTPTIDTPTDTPAAVLKAGIDTGHVIICSTPANQKIARSVACSTPRQSKKLINPTIKKLKSQQTKQAQQKMDNLLIVSKHKNELFTDCKPEQVQAEIERAKEFYTRDLKQ